MKSNPGVWVLLGLIAMLWATSAAQAQEPPAAERIPPLADSLQIDPPLVFCGERVPLLTPGVRERLEKELLLAVWNRPQVILWLKRSRRYLTPIAGILSKNDVPDDLKYIAVVESALRPDVISVKGAVGIWQLIRSTGRKYGLRIDEVIDQRRSLDAATGAAVLYLQKLHAEFGSWTLAAAAYNMGEKGLHNAIASQDTVDFYHLYLPRETQRFIFKILAAKLILAHPRKYGFNLPEKAFYAPIAAGHVNIVCPRSLHLNVLARAAKTYFKHFRDLNPQIRQPYLPHGRYRILVPVSALPGFVQRFRKAASRAPAFAPQHVYTVKKGDSLSVIARNLNVSLAALLRWNRLDTRRVIRPGQHLFFYEQREPVR